MTPPDDTHFRYVECDVPAGSSLSAWRRRDAAPHRPELPGTFRRLVRRVRRIARVSR